MVLQVDIVSDSSRNLSSLTPPMKCVFVSEQKDKTTGTLHSGVMEGRLRDESLTMSSVHCLQINVLVKNPQNYFIKIRICGKKWGLEKFV